MTLLFFLTLFQVCLFLVEKLLLAPIDFVTAFHLPNWLTFVLVLISLSWLMEQN